MRAISCRHQPMHCPAPDIVRSQPCLGRDGGFARLAPLIPPFPLDHHISFLFFFSLFLSFLSSPSRARSYGLWPIFFRIFSNHHSCRTQSHSTSIHASCKTCYNVNECIPRCQIWRICSLHSVLCTHWKLFGVEYGLPDERNQSHLSRNDPGNRHLSPHSLHCQHGVSLPRHWY